MNEQPTIEPHRSPANGSDGTAELLEAGLAEARELVRLEVSLAREEALTEARALKRSAIVFGTAVALGLLGFAALLTSLIVAIGWAAGIVVGVTLLLAAAGCGWWGRREIPEHPMSETKNRIVRDASNVRQRLS